MYKKSTCLCIFVPVCVSLYSLHPHPFQSNPGSQGITPRSRSKCHRITFTPLPPPLLLLSSLNVIPQKYSKKINASRLNYALPAPSKPSMDHPAVCERVLAPSLWAHSGRQLVGSCRFSSKLHKQSKLEVQPSLEAKPMWAIHTPVPVWGQWLQPYSPPAYSRPQPPSLTLLLSPLSFSSSRLLLLLS